MINIKQDLISFIVSICISLFLGVLILPILKRLKAKQNILGYVDNHAKKAGTSTMGGFIFALSAVITFLIFSKSQSRSIAIISIIVSLCFLLVGFLDDYIKIRSGNNQGLTALQKILFQTAISLLTAIFMFVKGYTHFFVPFINKYIDFGVYGAIIIFIVFLATTNCVNLTDGLDGLAGGVSYLFMILLYLLLRVQFELYPNNFVNLGEINNIMRLIIIQSGAIIGFLFFNTYQAKTFMGDTGSLYLGGFIATTAIFTSNTLFIPFFGIMFVISGISVIIQVAYYKLKRKRIFIMAPIHHHFQYKGHSESKIVFTYKLITLLVGIICIISVMRG